MFIKSMIKENDIMTEELKKCENPSCSAMFKPYSSRQKVCRRVSCRTWLREQNYKKVEYIFSKDFIKKNSSKKISELSFTRDDFIKKED